MKRRTICTSAISSAPSRARSRPIGAPNSAARRLNKIKSCSSSRRCIFSNDANKTDATSDGDRLATGSLRARKKPKTKGLRRGESGIRTHGRFNTSAVFKTAAINRSAISPRSLLIRRRVVDFVLISRARRNYTPSPRPRSCFGSEAARCSRTTSTRMTARKTALVIVVPSPNPPSAFA